MEVGVFFVFGAFRAVSRITGRFGEAGGIRVLISVARFRIYTVGFFAFAVSFYIRAYARARGMLGLLVTCFRRFN